jgi:hypothetical protein
VNWFTFAPLPSQESYDSSMSCGSAPPTLRDLRENAAAQGDAYIGAQLDAHRLIDCDAALTKKRQGARGDPADSNTPCAAAGQAADDRGRSVASTSSRIRMCGPRHR